MSLSIIDIEPINAELDPLDREPTLLSRSTQSVLFKTNFQQLQCNNESNIDWE